MLVSRSMWTIMALHSCKPVLEINRGVQRYNVCWCQDCFWDMFMLSSWRTRVSESFKANSFRSTASLDWQSRKWETCPVGQSMFEAWVWILLREHSRFYKLPDYIKFAVRIWGISKKKGRRLFLEYVWQLLNSGARFTECYQQIFQFINHRDRNLLLRLPDAFIGSLSVFQMQFALVEAEIARKEHRTQHIQHCTTLAPESPNHFHLSSRHV